MAPKLKFFLQIFVFFFMGLTSSGAKEQDSGNLKTLTYALRKTTSTTSNPQPVEFIAHEGTNPMQSYLAMSLEVAEYTEILQQLQAELKAPLKTRGEAHITVVTPVEFDKILSKKISIQDINKIALDMKIQQSPVERLCIGQGSLQIKEQKESTYFVVVKAPRLLEIRKAIKDAYVKKGGDENAFKPELFFPHVTLGFTLRDLHFEDGVIKDLQSCVYNIAEKP